MSPPLQTLRSFILVLTTRTGILKPHPSITLLVTHNDLSQNTMLQDLQITKNSKTKHWSPSYEQSASRYSKIGNHFHQPYSDMWLKNRPEME